MNTSTGEVIHLTEEEAVNLNKREWTQFTIGEIVEVKGIKFSVHNVGNQKLVLKFANKQPL